MIRFETLIAVIGASLMHIAMLAGPSIAAEAEPAAVGDEPRLWDCNRIPRSTGEELSKFLNAFCHIEKGWAVDKAVRLAGPVVDDIYYGAHGPIWAQVYYSPHVYTWLLEGRPDDHPLPDGSLIIKQQYVYQEKKAGPGPLEGWTVMLKDSEASHDGWVWAYIGYKDAQWDDSRPFIPYCVACHASADNRELTFSALERIIGIEDDFHDWVPHAPLGATGSTGTAPSQMVTPHDPGMHGAHPEVEVEANGAPGRPTLSEPLGAANPDFLAQFPWSHRVTRENVKTFPSQHYDHAVPTPGKPARFMTSDICSGCHDTASLIAYKTPDMMTNIGGHNFNLSTYGEWSASMMGLAGRDPVFFAQVETERTLHPELADAIDNKCFSCHGVMGQRQLKRDTGGERPFTHDIVYAGPGHPDAYYGALARDGISCTICHGMSPENMATPETYTGQFKMAPDDVIYGPYEEPQTYSMDLAMGVKPKFSAHIKDSAVCGSCHTVTVQQLDLDVEYTPETFAEAHVHHEQTTYLEWKNSAYWQPDYPAETKSCQSCHMPQAVEDIPPFTPDNPLKLAYRVANIQDPLYPDYINEAPEKDIALKLRESYSRHTLTGINLFVKQMFQQFTDILGIVPVSPNINRRENAVEALALAGVTGLHMAKVKTARVSVSDIARTDTDLVATVKIDSMVGHKFPSGVGFRRAFVEFRIEGEHGKVLWASGRPNRLGVIVGADGEALATEFSRSEWQPHHTEINSSDQVQIYEERYRDSRGDLTTSFLGLWQKVKDNRIVPNGWAAESAGQVSSHDYSEMVPCAFNASTGDCVQLSDADYKPGEAPGGDSLVYRVPLAAIDGARKIVVRIHYQSIPPYYLKERFDTANGPATQRLYYLASHLNTADSPIENWVLTVAETEHALP